MGTNINNCCCTGDEAINSDLQSPIIKERSSTKQSNKSNNSEPLFKQNSSLNQRAVDMVNSKDYL